MSRRNRLTDWGEHGLRTESSGTARQCLARVIGPSLWRVCRVSPSSKQVPPETPVTLTAASLFSFLVAKHETMDPCIISFAVIVWLCGKRVSGGAVRRGVGRIRVGPDFVLAFFGIISRDRSAARKKDLA